MVNGAAQRSSMPGSSADIGEPGDRSRPLVMLVEDNPDDRSVYASILSYHGFNVLEVTDGMTALNAVGVYRPDLILLDMRLPDVSGLEICNLLRTPSSEEQVIIIGLSSFPEVEMGDRALAAGCTHYLEKSAGPLTLLRMIQGLLGTPPNPDEDPMPRHIVLDGMQDDGS